MSTAIDVSLVGDKELIEKLTIFEDRTVDDPSLLTTIAIQIKNNIFLRTSSGKDKDNKSFKRYNPEYAKRNQKNTVNMTLTGEMMNSITQTLINNNSAKIFFSTEDARQKAVWHNLEGAGESKVIRKFFGFNKKDEKQALGVYQDEMNRVQKELNL